MKKTILLFVVACMIFAASAEAYAFGDFPDIDFPSGCDEIACNANTVDPCAPYHCVGGFICSVTSLPDDTACTLNMLPGTCQSGVCTPIVIPPVPVCGNGIIEITEVCDDGNMNAGDGCSATCAVESGWNCAGTPSVCIPAQVCGNGIIESGETCDDGDASGGDGCSATCLIESGYVCGGSPSTCMIIPLMCIPTGAEVCDGVDNDCDGQIDEGGVCVVGSDNDGDGSLDADDVDDDNDGVLDGVDASPLNPQICEDVDGDGCDDCSQNPTSSSMSNNPPWPLYFSSPLNDGPDADGDGVCDLNDLEVCNGQDDDGDGSIDEDLEAPLCTSQSGVCMGSRMICDGANGWQDCTSSDYTVHSEDYESSELSCDGMDNDCDSFVDEDGVCLPASPSYDFVGSTGVIADLGASSPLYYLRHVGNPAPAGYSHAYQWANPAMICDPENTPTVFTGTIDVSSMVAGDVTFIGLIDKGHMADGKTGFQSGAYIYVYKLANGKIRLGPTDGNLNGEIVQTYVDYDAPVDGVFDISMTIFDGGLSLEVDGGSPLVDTYGDIKVLNNDPARGLYAWEEFEYGAYPGWDSWPDTTTVAYDFEMTGCVLSETICGDGVDNDEDGDVDCDDSECSATPLCTPLQLNILGFVDAGTPLVGNLVDGFALPITGVPGDSHYISFGAGTSANQNLEDDYFGLFIIGLTSDEKTALKEYYAARGVPEPYLSYLKDAVDGLKPFAYIKGDGTTTMLLVDAAKQDIQGLDEPMEIPDDYPVGEYVVSGVVADEYGHMVDVTFKLLVSPVCSPECVHGACVAPNMCECTPGWTGDACELFNPADYYTKQELSSVLPGLGSELIGFSGSWVDSSVFDALEWLYLKVVDLQSQIDTIELTPGPQGPQGEQGPPGEKGDKGDKGDAGDTGAVGPQGPQGEKGDKGDKGDTGATGATGATGPTGPTGATGAAGLAGINCWDLNNNRACNLPTEDLNSDGVCSVLDCKGATGATGPQGPQGPQGEQGLQGEKGDAGETGPQGPQGAVGPQGIQGEPGETGAVGPQGPQGEKGDKGDVGETGPQGLQGEKGDVGEVGPQGVQGEQGLQGVAGLDGLSCWDLDGDGVADVEEDVNLDGVWDALDCQGAVGAQGETGPQGPPGEIEMTMSYYACDNLGSSGIKGCWLGNHAFCYLTGQKDSGGRYNYCDINGKLNGGWEVKAVRAWCEVRCINTE